MLGFDHIVIAVDDLDAAIQDYTDLGFTVLPGGRHANGATHNALVVLADGSYLELMALTGDGPQNDAADYSFLLQDGEGFVGYCLTSDDLDADAMQMSARGVEIGHLTDGGRKRQDGTDLKWQTMSIEASMSPFFIQDVTARDLRVPTDPTRTQHANGALGVSALTIVVENVQEAIVYYWQITGESIAVATPDSAMYQLGDFSITLAEPADAAMRMHLQQRQGVPYLLTLKTQDASSAGLLDPAKAHGTRIVLLSL
jgi:catechol 2,3-dioxygenase-like lactoylglutathione lyase family enzyme